jgi:predicted  nucleic acid-binding Zn-ribbon protein
MNTLVAWSTIALLCLAPLITHAQEKSIDASSAARSTTSGSDTSSNFDGRITEASKIPDADQKFRAMRSIRNELTRTIDETKVQRSALQDEISRLSASRKDLLPPTPAFQPVGEPSQEKVESDLKDAKSRVKELSDQLATLKRSDADWDRVNSDLNQAKANQSSIEFYMGQLKSRKELADKQAKDLEALDRRLEGLRADEANVDKTLKKLIASQGGLDDEINDTLRTDGQRNSFKTEIAFAFSLLVAAVIGGFFFLASKDEVVRRAIFSGEAGIQFLTLFSVVIAIILFGITGILESKELAALLGGLSGYILGRVTSKS